MLSSLTRAAIASITIILAGCWKPAPTELRVIPVIATERVPFDSDDPAIWVDPTDSTRVLIIGTDKGGDTGQGGLYAFDLAGKIVSRVQPLQRPNNVDIGYLDLVSGGLLSVAVATERYTNSIRVFRLPDLLPVDGGGIPVFEGDSLRDPMGVAIYKDMATREVYAIVGRKSGPTTGYLGQYRLTVDSTGQVRGQFVRKFGTYSGQKEIESIAVDAELGYVYCSDEGVGVRKYYAHPDSTSRELALFATEKFTQDHEGISIYKHKDGTGFILVSNQQDNSFHVYPREGASGDPHQHPLLKVVPVSTNESDGSEVTSRALPGFPRGLFIAMSDDGTFQYYRWEDLQIDN
jgi:3-phytase